MPDGNWPLKSGESGAQTSGLVQAVKAGEGTIGYADESQAGDLGVAKVKVGNTYVAPSAEGASNDFDKSKKDPAAQPGQVRVRLHGRADADGPERLPDPARLLADGLHEVHSDTTTTDLVKAYFNYVVSDDGQQVAAQNAGSAPIAPGRSSPRIRTRSTRSAADPKVHLNGRGPRDRRVPRGRRTVRTALSYMEAHTETTTQAGQILASASGGRRRPGDRIFSNAAVIAAVTVLAILAGVAIFLLIKSLPAVTASAAELPEGKNLVDYIAPLAFGTILAAVVAVIIAVPLAVAVALFISHIAPRRIAQHARLHRRPAGRDPEHRLRALGDLRARPRDRAGARLARATTSASSRSSTGPPR